MRKTAIILLASLIFCVSAMAADTVKVGDPPPPYIGKTVDGTRVNLPSLRGDVVVISFWASWCRYCIQELPQWAAIQAIAAKRGLHMQVVAVDYKDARNIFHRTAHYLKPHVPGLILTSDPDGDIGKLYDITAIPVVVMLHRNGKVAYMHVGYDKKEFDTMLKEVNTLLNEPMLKESKKDS